VPIDAGMAVAASLITHPGLLGLVSSGLTLVQYRPVDVSGGVITPEGTLTFPSADFTALTTADVVGSLLSEGAGLTEVAPATEAYSTANTTIARAKRERSNTRKF
jgi:hypothetical protein